MKKVNLLLTTTLVFLAVLSSCSKDSVEDLIIANTDTTSIDPCDTIPVTWSGVIIPILQTNCSQNFNPSQSDGCHQSGAPFFGDFTIYQNVKDVVDNGNLAARVLVSSPSMPPSYSQGPTGLPPCDVKLIQRWIDDGAPEN